MKFTEDDKKQFFQDGYIIVRELFSKEEMHYLITSTKGDSNLTEHDHSLADKGELKSKLRLINYLEDSISSAFVASRRIVDNMEFLLDDEVYHFHHKMMLKEAKVGGAWHWHQDYGYWYEYNNCLFPDMASCAIAVDACTKENGCLQVLKGSNRCGRIKHGPIGAQTGADVEKGAALETRLETGYAEMEPGDGLFFHCNTLHRSDANLSENPRWILIGCYNTKHNSPYEKAHHPDYHPLEKVNDDNLLEIAKGYCS